MDPRVLNPDAGAPTKERPRVVYPAWMDGHFLTVASHVAASDPFVVPMMSPLRWAPNPRRWAIGFFGSSGFASDLVLSPDPRPDLFALARSTTSANIWLTLFQYGPIITNELYLYSSIGGTFKCYEVEV